MLSRSLAGVLLVLVLTGLMLPLATAEGLFVSLDGLLPSKNDDPATYPVLQEPQWYYANSWDENLIEPGFLEGRAVGYYKRYFAHSDMSVEFYVYLFSNVSSAEAYYSKEVDHIRSEGGYTEVSIANACAVIYDYGTQQIGVSWGAISNLVFKVAVYTANIVEDPTDQLVSFTFLERSRILEKSQGTGTIPEIPEFPSISVIVLLMIAAIATAKIWRRSPQHNYPLLE